MFEAYKVAVKLTLVNEVTKNLTAMSAVFGKLGRDVDVLQSKLNRLKKVAVVGGLALGGGMFGLHLLAKAVKPAEEYAHQLNIMNMAGMKQQEIAEATAAAWKTSKTVLGSTPTGNLQTFMDLRNIFGDVRGKNSAAIQDMPELVRIGAVLKASSSGNLRDNADNLAFSIAKALDMRNAVSNTGVFNQQAEMMTKVITALQGRVLPEDYRMLFKYGRQAVPGLSNEFLYEELPTFMMEMKGKGGGSGGSGGFGTSLAAFYRFFVQGVMSKASLHGLQSVGLIGSSAALRTTTTGTMLKFGSHIKDVGLAQTDPFQYVQKVLLPAIHKKYGDNLTNNQLSLIIGQIMKGSAQTAQFAVLQYALKAQNVYRDQKLIKEATDSKVAYQMALSNDPATAFAALTSQLNAFETALTLGVIPVLVPALIKLSDWLNKFGEIARKYPKFTRDIVFGFGGISAVLTVVGAVTLPLAVVGMWRLNRSIVALTAVANGAAAKMGLSEGAAATGARAAGGAAALAGGGMLAGAALFAYGGYKAYPLLRGLWHYYNGDDQQKEIAKLGGEYNRRDIINLQVNQETLGQVVLDYINKETSLMQNSAIGTVNPGIHLPSIALPAHVSF